MPVDDLRKFLEAKTLDELRTLARSVTLRGYSNLPKQELIDELIAKHADQLAIHIRPPSFWARYHNHIYGMVGVIGLGLSLLTFWPDAQTSGNASVDPNAQALSSPEVWQPQYTDRKPKIIGLYPADGFGPLRKKGLHAFTDDFAEVKVIDLDSATIAEMKADGIEQLREQLSDIIAEDNVLGIVGPSITECTRSILRTIAESGKQVPVILECAGGPGTIGWREFSDELPILRISSGVDRRASEIAWLIEDLVSSNQPVQLLIEQHAGAGRPTYGEYLYEEIERQIGSWNEYVNQGLIDALYFPTDDIESKLPEIESKAKTRALILLLGLGSHYKAIADEIYRDGDSHAATTAPLVGWMTAYGTDRAFRSGGNYQHDLLFEITDLDIINAGPQPEVSGKFRSELGEPTPAVRDQAFSFDAGYCLVEAYRAVVDEHFPHRAGQYPKLDEGALQLVVADLRSRLFRGVTGDIRFGQHGQNNDGRLIYARFNTSSATWKPVDYKEIVDREFSGAK